MSNSIFLPSGDTKRPSRTQSGIRSYRRLWNNRARRTAERIVRHRNIPNDRHRHRPRFFQTKTIARLCECLTSIDACPPSAPTPRPIVPSDFSEYKTSIFATKFGRVDIVRTADAIGHYKDIVKTAEPVSIHGTEFLLASLQTIERSKRRAGRLKDKSGIHAIKQLKQAYRAKISSLRRRR